MVYELRTSRATSAYCSRLRVRADTLLLADNLRFVVAVQAARSIVVYRVEVVRGVDYYSKYMIDNHPADDAELADTQHYYYSDDDEPVDERQVSCSRVDLQTRGVATGGVVYRYIYHPKSVYLTNFYVVRPLLVVFRYRASVRLSKISKVEIYTPPQMKFLATPLLQTRHAGSQF